MKTILASILAVAFLASTPVFAADSPAGSDKAEKGDKAQEGRQEEGREEGRQEGRRRRLVSPSSPPPAQPALDWHTQAPRSATPPTALDRLAPDRHLDHEPVTRVSTAALRRRVVTRVTCGAWAASFETAAHAPQSSQADARLERDAGAPRARDGRAGEAGRVGRAAYDARRRQRRRLAGRERRRAPRCRRGRPASGSVRRSTSSSVRALPSLK